MLCVMVKLFSIVKNPKCFSTTVTLVEGAWPLQQCGLHLTINLSIEWRGGELNVLYILYTATIYFTLIPCPSFIQGQVKHMLLTPLFSPHSASKSY